MTDNAGQTTVTRLLRQISAGDREALNDLYPLVYDELRALARAQRRHRADFDTLNTTALVHEVYLKLVGQDNPQWRDRAHFSAVAATAMQHLRIDYARRAHAARRGGRRVRLSLDQIEHSLTSPGAGGMAEEPELLVLLDEALRKLEQVSERQVRIVSSRGLRTPLRPWSLRVEMNTEPSSRARSEGSEETTGVLPVVASSCPSFPPGTRAAGAETGFRLGDSRQRPRSRSGLVHRTARETKRREVLPQRSQIPSQARGRLLAARDDSIVRIAPTPLSRPAGEGPGGGRG